MYHKPAELQVSGYRVSEPGRLLKEPPWPMCVSAAAGGAPKLLRRGGRLAKRHWQRWSPLSAWLSRG